MSELALEGLSVEQLEQLIEDQPDDEGKEALRALLDQRHKLDEISAKATKRKGNRSGAGRTPTDRHLNAVEHFNADPEKLARLSKAIAEAVDTDGNQILTVELIRIGIGAYYDQRKRDDEAKKAQTANPSVPVSETLDDSVSDTADEETGTAVSEPDDAYEATEVAESAPWDSDDDGDEFPNQ